MTVQRVTVSLLRIECAMQPHCDEWGLARAASVSGLGLDKHRGMGSSHAPLTPAKTGPACLNTSFVNCQQ